MIIKNIISKIAGVSFGILGSLDVISGGGGPVNPILPEVSAEKVKITFTSDISVDSSLPIPVVRLLESIEITPAKDETHISHYNVYWGDTEKNKLGLGLAKQLAHIPIQKNADIILHEFPEGLKMEVGAKYVLVCSENDGVEYCGKDNNLQLVWDDLVGTALAAEKFKADIAANDELTCPGLGIMNTCGDLVCNSEESVSSCPSDCKPYSVASFNYQTICSTAKKVFHPKSVNEIQAIIRDAKKKNLRVKVTAGAGPKGTSGSASDIVCGDGVIIVADKINHSNPNFPITLETFEGKQVVNVPAGERLHDLGEWLFKRGKQLGYVHLGWRDVTVAGAIGTSAHGSSPKQRNVIAYQVMSLDVVDPNGNLKTYSRHTTGKTDPNLWQAMLTHLGYFGVITRVRLAIEEAKNVHVKVTYHNDNELFDNSDPSITVFDDIKDCDYGQYNWFPSLEKYVRWCGKTTDKQADNGANNRLLSPFGAAGESPLQPQPEDILKAYQVGACFPDSRTNKVLATLRADGFHLTPPMVKERNGKSVYSSDVIGPVHRMTSAHLVDVGKEVFQMDWEVAVPFKHMESALEWVNNFTKGLNEKNRELNLPLIGIFVRFSKVEEGALLSYTGAGGDFESGSTAVHIEMPIWVPINLPSDRMADYMSPYENAMHILVNDFGARAHWGKNQYWSQGKSNNAIFHLQRQINTYGDSLARFNKAIASFDPKGMFANPQAKVIGIKYPSFDYPEEW